MSKVILTILIAFSIFVSTQNVSAFDGNRKGFVLSGGVELLKISTSGGKNSYYPGDEILTSRFSIGYAFNEKNIITYDNRISIYDRNNEFDTYRQTGISWSHYFSNKDNSFLFDFGIESNPETIHFGGGYMFSNNIQIGLNYYKISNFNNSTSLKLLLSYVAF